MINIIHAKVCVILSRGWGVLYLKLHLHLSSVNVIKIKKNICSIVPVYRLILDCKVITASVSQVNKGEKKTSIPTGPHSRLGQTQQTPSYFS